MVVLGNSEVAFLGEREDAAIVFGLYTALQYRSCRSSNSLLSWPYGVWNTSGGISSRLAAFLFLIFLSTTSNSSLVSCPSLMSSWLLIIFVIGLAVTLRDFSSRFLKCSSHMCFYWILMLNLRDRREYFFFFFFFIWKLKLWSHGKQHGWCEFRRMNLALGQWRASSDAWRKNSTGQWPG